MPFRRTLVAVAAALTLAGMLAGAPADAVPAPAVPVPTVIGPVPDEVGIKGEAWFDPPFVLGEAEPIPYLSEEFFLDGEARNLLNLDAPTAAYRTRMLVVRPVDAADFTGAVVVEWDNVTAQAALNPLWMWDHPYLMREGHAFVSVSAQKVGVDGPSPLAHTQWDPPRYGTLVHPGDTYSYDIFAQAVEALRTNAPSAAAVIDGVELPAGATTLGNLDRDATSNGDDKDKGKDKGKGKGHGHGHGHDHSDGPGNGNGHRHGDGPGNGNGHHHDHDDDDDDDGSSGEPIEISIIATGTSQSSSRLVNHLDDIEGITADNIDGFLLDAGGSRTFDRIPAKPTVDFDSEDQLNAGQPTGAGQDLLAGDLNYRLWEVPAASHADAEFSRYIEDGLYYTHILEADEIPWKQWDDRRYEYRYGDEGPGLRTGCQPLGYGDNTYPRRYAARAAMDDLINWVQTGDPAEAIQPPRVSYEAGTEVKDANRQIVGGVRLPQIDVPVADYLATTCGLFGQTVSFDPLTLQTLYPTTADYTAAMDSAIVSALAEGYLLEAEAAELRVQLETAVIPAYRSPEGPGHADEGAAHFFASIIGPIG